MSAIFFLAPCEIKNLLNLGRPKLTVIKMEKQN